MQRILASLLLAVITLTLAPFAFSSDSGLPACCRKDGKHKCAMLEMALDDDSGVSLRGVTRCPAFPSKLSLAAAINAATFPVALQTLALVSHPRVVEEADAQYRVSFSRCRQKRGPPAALSL